MLVITSSPDAKSITLTLNLSSTHQPACWKRCFCPTWSAGSHLFLVVLSPQKGLCGHKAESPLLTPAAQTTIDLKDLFTAQIPLPHWENWKESHLSLSEIEGWKERRPAGWKDITTASLPDWPRLFLAVTAPVLYSVYSVAAAPTPHSGAELYSPSAGTSLPRPSPGAEERSVRQRGGAGPLWGNGCAGAEPAAGL